MVRQGWGWATIQADLTPIPVLFLPQHLRLSPLPDVERGGQSTDFAPKPRQPK